MYTGSHLIAIILTLSGIYLLANSFVHRKFLCDQHQSRSTGWCVLFALIAFFIIGYTTYLYFVLSTTEIGIYHILAASIFLGGGVFVRLVIHMSQGTVSDVIQIAEKDRHNALHDALTGLPNRTLLYERIEQAILHAKRQLNTATIILIDLDRFKDVNDTLGHTMGDRLLKQVTPRIKNCIREVDTIARIGGDEFVVVLPGASRHDAIRIVKTIHQQIDKSFKIDDHVLNIGSSMGVAIYPYHGEDPQSLLQHADIAMYKAKRNATDYEIYNVSDDEYSVNRLELVNSVREAVREKSFNLVYQPKMNLQSGKVTSVEALLRWQDIQLGPVSPDEFIPVIEHIGLIKELTIWVITQAMLQQRAWHQQGLDIKIAVNVSANNLSDAQFPKDIQQLLDDIDIAPENIILEITESSMMQNPEHAMKLLTELSAMGLTLSIDDFGTGYSSLAYLKNLPASEVKIDKSFISDIMQNENDAVIVYATISLLHNLGFNIVAEGVETEEILDCIGMWGCDQAQGFFVCKPQSASNIYNFILIQNGNITQRRSNVSYLSL